MHYSLYYPFGCRRTKKDYSTAIMDRKKAPHKLQVEDSKQDDNSIVEMTQAKMDELKIFRGDAVILKGKCVTQTAWSSFRDSTNLLDADGGGLSQMLAAIVLTLMKYSA